MLVWINEKTRLLVGMKEYYKGEEIPKKLEKDLRKNFVEGQDFISLKKKTTPKNKKETPPVAEATTESKDQ